MLNGYSHTSSGSEEERVAASQQSLWSNLFFEFSQLVSFGVVYSLCISLAIASPPPLVCLLSVSRKAALHVAYAS